MTTTTALDERARRALEDVCSGCDPDALPDLYSTEFVDLRITVEQQVTQGRQVASLWRTLRVLARHHKQLRT